MKGFPLAAAVAVLACVPTLAGGQTLGEIARKIEENKKAAPPPARFDERDVNAAAARRELLEFRLEAPVWERFLTADRRVAVALAHDPSLLERLEGLNYTTRRSVGHFFKREPAIAAALKEAGVDPHDYATVYLATKLAFSREPYALSPAVQLNLVFLKTRTPDVEGLAVPLGKLSLHTLGTPPRPKPTLPRGTPGARTKAAPAAALDDGGPIDMSYGAQIPDFSFVDFDGHVRRLSEFRGKYVMLDFWGSWCPPCRAEVPYVKAAYTRFASRGFEVLGMDSERDASIDDVRAYLQKNGVRWSFARLSNGEGASRDRERTLW